MTGRIEHPRTSIMAITVSSDVAAKLTTVKRKYRINVDSPAGGVYGFTAFYETVVSDADGNVISRQPSDQFFVASAAIADVAFTIGGVTLTGAQIQELVSAVVDHLCLNPIAPGTAAVTIPLE
jgi:hypothetical protein